MTEPEFRKHEMDPPLEAKKTKSNHEADLAAGGWIKELIESISKKNPVEMKPPIITTVIWLLHRCFLWHNIDVFSILFWDTCYGRQGNRTFCRASYPSIFLPFSPHPLPRSTRIQHCTNKSCRKQLRGSNTACPWEYGARKHTFRWPYTGVWHSKDWAVQSFPRNGILPKTS